jgi:hypothetical protein
VWAAFSTGLSSHPELSKLSEYVEKNSETYREGVVISTSEHRSQPVRAWSQARSMSYKPTERQAALRLVLREFLEECCRIIFRIFCGPKKTDFFSARRVVTISFKRRRRRCWPCSARSRRQVPCTDRSWQLGPRLRRWRRAPPSSRVCRAATALKEDGLDRCLVFTFFFCQKGGADKFSFWAKRDISREFAGADMF